MHQNGNCTLNALIVASLLCLAACKEKSDPLSQSGDDCPPHSEITVVSSSSDHANKSSDAQKQRQAELVARMAALKAEATVPYRADEDLRTNSNRTTALRDLVRTGTHEGVETVLAVLLDPANEHLWIYPPAPGPDTNQAAEKVEHSPHSQFSLTPPYEDFIFTLLTLSQFIEDTPPPSAGEWFTVKDIPIWRQWWEANKDNLRFKPEPKKPEWHGRKPINRPEPGK